MIGLTAPVNQLHGIGPSTTAKLQRLGIRSVADLLSHFPIRHEDLTHVTTIAGLRSNTTAVLRGRLQLLKSRRGYRRRRMSITEGLFEDGSGTVRLVWFNQPYIGTSYKPGDEVFIVGSLMHGKYGPQMQSPLVERVKDKQLLAGRILPVYRATAGLTQRQIRQLVEAALPATAKIPDWMPDGLRRDNKLPILATAIRDIHFPRTRTALDAARQRLKFNELFLFSLAIMQAEELRQSKSSPAVPFDRAAIQKFVASLPFRMTDDQRRAAWDILQDLEHEQPMHRLLQGDVGSGKTVVAAVGIRNAAVHGFQSAVLAPTDILAGQHFQTFVKFFGPDLNIALLTAARRAWTLPGTPTKRDVWRELSSGKIQLVIGTQAILQPNVKLPRLALAVIDEQHRFGVEQRRNLMSKIDPQVPHLLSMTATPIPRTLTLALYGDLKVSQLRHQPPGRGSITTAVVSPDDQTGTYQHLRERIDAGEQAYIICPLIEESDELGVAAATSEFERLLAEDLAGYRIGLLHGRMSGRDKTKVLSDFASGQIDALVATPVVEVGIDVPNATAMIIEGAERFGLSQLHQLRGRIGRGAKPSTCFLFTESTDREVRERLAIVAATSDGFELAEADLARRGPGDVYGIRQSGLPQFSMASLSDVGLMQAAHQASRALLTADPGLSKHPVIAKKSKQLFSTIHPE